MEKVLACLGEILFDFLPLEEGGETVGFRMRPGGGPFNVAVGLARLGAPTAFIGRLSGDFFGRRLRRYLREQGIGEQFLVDDPAAPTTLAIVASEGGEPSFTFYGEGAADTRLSPDDLPPGLEQQLALLHFGGISLLRGSTPAAALTAAERLQGKGLVSLDPNVRPALVADGEAYRATLARAVAACDLLKVSAADLAWLAPGHNPEEAAAELLEQGPAMVALTLGGEGAAALRRGDDGRVERVAVAGFPIRVADTVGAGDAFTGGLLAALADRGALSREALAALPAADLIESLRFAAAAAAITCTRPGADPPTRPEVEALLLGL